MNSTSLCGKGNIDKGYYSNFPLLPDGQFIHADVNICYGIIYGIGAKSLGEQMGVQETDALCFIESFKSRYPDQHMETKFLKETVKKCTQDGFVQTIMGRRRYLPAIKETNPYKKAQAERQAVNTVIQGSAADIVKVATANIQTQLEALPSTVKSFGHLESPFPKILS
ncbi:DNA polymerase theta, partial [Ophiophagus hannah]